MRGNFSVVLGNLTPSVIHLSVHVNQFLSHPVKKKPQKIHLNIRKMVQGDC